MLSRVYVHDSDVLPRERFVLVVDIHTVRHMRRRVIFLQNVLPYAIGYSVTTDLS